MAKFRLQRVIEIKNRIMDDKKKEMELATSALYRIDETIAEVEATTTRSYETMSAPMGGSDFSVLKDFLFSLEVRKEELVKERAEAVEKLHVIKTALIELAKEIKMLDTLKAKALERERKLLNKKEQKIMDEIALRSPDRKI
jgi:flagellar export protein FliJ